MQTFLETLLVYYKNRNFIHSKLMTTQQTLAVFSSYVREKIPPKVNLWWANLRLYEKNGFREAKRHKMIILY